MIDIPITTDADAEASRANLVDLMRQCVDKHLESARLLRERNPRSVSAELHEEEAARVLDRAKELMACTPTEALLLIQKRYDAAQLKKLSQETSHVGVIAEA